MDFNIKKPTHIFALIMIIITFLVFIILPVLSYFGMSFSTQTDQISGTPGSFGIIFEIIVLLLQTAIVIALFIIIPVLWYLIVNKFTLKETFYHLKLRIHGIDIAVLWGVITAIVALVVIVAIGALLMSLGLDLTDASNIPELELYFSLPSMLFLIAFQPIAEEIFFRGFLLEKIDSIIGEKTAIITTAILFGIAHLSVGNIYPAFATGVIGVLLAFLVIKTKNLYSAITAHIIFNLVSFSIYIFAKSIL